MESAPMIRFLLLTPFLMVASMLGATFLIWAGAMSPIAGFGATMGAWVVGALSGLLCGLIGAFRRDSRPLAWRALAVGVMLAALLGLVGMRVRTVPIHDITTDPDDAPPFTVAAEHPDNAGRDLSYPHGNPETAMLQRRHFPDLSSPVWCDEDAAQIWLRALAAAEAMDWNLTSVNSADRLIEAEATSRIFRFVDDVVIRVHSPAGGCVHVDVRSTSRVGQSDLGANAARIAEYLGRL